MCRDYLAPLNDDAQCIQPLIQAIVIVRGEGKICQKFSSGLFNTFRRQFEHELAEEGRKGESGSRPEIQMMKKSKITNIGF